MKQNFDLILTFQFLDPIRSFYIFFYAITQPRDDLPNQEEKTDIFWFRYKMKPGRRVFYLTRPSNPSPSNPNQQHYITKKEFITNLT